MGCCSGGIVSNRSRGQGTCSQQNQLQKASGPGEPTTTSQLSDNAFGDGKISVDDFSEAPRLLEILSGEPARIANKRVALSSQCSSPHMQGCGSQVEPSLEDSVNCSFGAPRLSNGLADSHLSAGIRLAEKTLAECGVLDAEKVFLSLARSFMENGDLISLSGLRLSEAYQSVLQSAQSYEQGVGNLLESLEGWDLIKTFRVPYKDGGLEEVWPKVIGEKGDRCQIFSKLCGKRINVKVISEFPAIHPELGSHYLCGYIGMWHELDLWHSWHPIIFGNGPTPLQTMSKDHNLWEQCAKLTIPPLRLSQIIENRNFFDIEEGIFYQSQEVLLPERLKFLCCPDPPKGFHRGELYVLISQMVICQETSNAVVVGVSVDLDFDPPKWIVNLLCSWLVPTIAQNLFKTGIGVMSSPTYAERFKHDQQGLYRDLENIAEAGKRCERSRGFKYRPGLHASMDGFPPPSLVTTNRQNSLNAFERTVRSKHAVHCRN